MTDAAVAVDTAGRGGLWALREGITDAIAQLGVPHKVDVGVPLAGLAHFLREVGPTVRRVSPAARTVVFGHLGDGNLHVNVLAAAGHDGAVDGAVLGLALACGGTISAEHGVGIAKAAHLHHQRGSRDMAAMRAVKRALDPRGLLNPGAVLASPADGRDLPSGLA